jgi:flavin reductase (DIM6/NTAB) family NADH-FMN oxidoreductase RutF
MPAAITAPLFREAMSRVAGAVHLVATDGAAGKAGLTATAMTSVSDDPPTLLVCLNRASRTAAMLRENGAFSVNTLGGNHQALAEIFAGRTDLHGEARFGHGAWRIGLLDQPVLVGALAAFTVKVEDIRTVASHLVVIGRILAVEIGPDQPGLVYARRRYRSV